MNDLEATIVRLERHADPETEFADRLTIQSLENRREMLRSDLAEATRSEFIEVCDYRIIPDSGASYSVSAVTGVLRTFQELVTIVFDAITTQPKERTTSDPAIIAKTQFDFGFAYSGSLGVALTIENERLLAIESHLDQAIDAVFGLLKVDSAEGLHGGVAAYGTPAVRKLYALSKLHRDYGMSADIKWVRDGETRKQVLTQPPEFSELCSVIERRGEEHTEDFEITGLLEMWDHHGRRFLLSPPEGDPLRGAFAESFDATTPRRVPERYKVMLVRHMKFNYAKDREEVSWELVGIEDLN
ncbi:hypothetical protein HBA54_21180 [Pelagibius litoralis]|uniref:Uncharacterized protein n=1 Tax=Pelagibius litoralis TaxID=374515 RepID=A0A967KHB8_9PROT|nr:hypothetical protein [Pelagibius litoralis]NIA71116.1 hypothetical protein [Pelagibius litoralis]